jgi:nucleoside-diphosphate-sugar epimerase
MSFTPRQIADAIAQRLPGFMLRCEPDFRQAIAQSWPASIDDAPARADWGWQPRYDLQSMVDAMLTALRRW